MVPWEIAEGGGGIGEELSVEARDLRLSEVEGGPSVGNPRLSFLCTSLSLSLTTAGEDGNLSLVPLSLLTSLSILNGGLAAGTETGLVVVTRVGCTNGVEVV